MAKNTKKVTLEVNAVPAPSSVKSNEAMDWQTQDDARDLMRMGGLLRDNGRLSRARGCLQNALDLANGGRSGRKKSSRSGRVASRSTGR